MAGYEFLRTSRGAVMLQDSQQFQYYMKKNTPEGGRRFLVPLNKLVFIIIIMYRTKNVIKDVLKNAAANPDLGTRNIFADLTVKVFWSS